MKLGDLEFYILSDGPFRLDGGAMFGIIPRPMWEKKLAPDSRNRIGLTMNCLLVRTAGQWVLIDTGAGDKLDAKRNDIYGLGGPPRLLDRLAQRGVRPEDISLVIDTHLHFDHCGWNTRIVDGKCVPTFPNARYLVQRGELEWAEHPSERDRASYMPENFAPITAAGKWWLVDGDAEVAPGIEVIRMPGHNRDMQCVRLTGGGQTAFFFVDLVSTIHHLPVPWVLGYDLYPMQTMENKKIWIPQAVRGHWLCLFTHDADTPAGYLHGHDGKYEIEPVRVD